MSGTYTSKNTRKCSYRSIGGTGTSTKVFVKAGFQTLSIIRAAAS